MTMRITTNWVPRDMVAFIDLPAEVQKEFDYITDGDIFDYRFVQYRGVWYDVYDTQTIDPVKPGEYTGYVGWGMKVHPGSPLAHFDSIISDSYFSGVLFRLCEDDKVVVATYMS